MMTPTPRQQQCFDFIRAFKSENGVVPSFEEIAKGLGLKSRSSVFQFIEALEARGYVRRLKGKQRALELIEPNSKRAVLVNPDVYSLLKAYAQGEQIAIDTAASELLRDALGAA
jgi:repressor LexA